ncbi:hypothetical protein CQA66_01570 [Helicobacter aurati]|uniref:Secreted protein n=1 Tax=Helicobacter aurati TaxID=137778 RepID=A0A3D8J7J0_9HELI|nr:hypothetical protein CQA66_01570 [Helicobacter aurati]
MIRRFFFMSLASLWACVDLCVSLWDCVSKALREKFSLAQIFVVRIETNLSATCNKCNLHLDSIY